ncbi:hypothetical protein PR202_ga17719 [Eleusine coracana subsp. coracana]|uniref:Uncharacterized protein n=1 Tax=Eleusine coracana subsp. coracana TaxID=191504 RepID=A0AAV5CQS1_ELECO|nr:hypothetical protein PR202_ga17472 [Eleusine coracana subsp. coracana]GJN00530.1 hypothetical protein PR202_ga17719 [Eleusine coracana subsp. coracana]
MPPQSHSTAPRRRSSWPCAPSTVKAKHGSSAFPGATRRPAECLLESSKPFTIPFAKKAQPINPTPSSSSRSHRKASKERHRREQRE